MAAPDQETLTELLAASVSGWQARSLNALAKLAGKSLEDLVDEAYEQGDLARAEDLDAELADLREREPEDDFGVDWACEHYDADQNMRQIATLFDCYVRGVPFQGERLSRSSLLDILRAWRLDWNPAAPPISDGELLAAADDAWRRVRFLRVDRPSGLGDVEVERARQWVERLPRRSSIEDGIVYHGTYQPGLTELRYSDPNYVGSLGAGVYVAYDPAVAQFYGPYVYKLRLKINQDQIFWLEPHFIEGRESESILVGEQVPPFRFELDGQWYTVDDRGFDEPDYRRMRDLVAERIDRDNIFWDAVVHPTWDGDPLPDPDDWEEYTSDEVSDEQAERDADAYRDALDEAYEQAKREEGLAIGLDDIGREVELAGYRAVYVDSIRAAHPTSEMLVFNPADLEMIGLDEDLSRRRASKALAEHYKDLYDRVRAAGAIELEDGRLALSVGTSTMYMAPPQGAVEQMIEFAMRHHGLTRQDAEKELATHLQDELMDLVTAFEEGAAERIEQRKREHKVEQTLMLGRDLSSDLVSVYTDLPKSGLVWTWHGTSTALLPDILEHGLVPSSKGGQTFDDASEGFVFLSLTGNVDFYAERAAAVHGGEPVVLRVLVDAADLEPDPDDADISSGREQVVTRRPIPPSAIYQVGDEWTRTAACREANKRLRSLVRRLGDEASIPQDAIDELAALDPDGRKGYVNWVALQAQRMVTPIVYDPADHLGEMVFFPGTSLRGRIVGVDAEDPDGAVVEFHDGTRSTVWYPHLTEPDEQSRRYARDTFVQCAETMQRFDAVRRWIRMPQGKQLRDLNEQTVEDLIRLGEARKEAWENRPRKDRARQQVILDEPGRRVTRYDTADAMTLDWGGRSDWCVAKWRHEDWDLYSSTGSLFVVELDGEPYLAHVKGGTWLGEVANRRNRRPPDEVKDEVRLALEDAGAIAGMSKSAAKVLVWHGTSGGRLKRILTEGLRSDPPRRTYETEEAGPARSLETFGGVYLTPDWYSAYAAAGHAVDNESESLPDEAPEPERAIIGVRAETRSPGVLIDEDAFDGSLTTVAGRIANETIEKPAFSKLRALVPEWHSGRVLPDEAWAKVADTLAAEDLSGAAGELLDTFSFHQPQIKPVVERRREALLPLAEEAIKGYVLHLFERAFDYAKRHNADVISWDPARWDEQLAALEKPASLTGTFPLMQRKVDALLAKLSQAASPSQEQWRSPNFRLPGPITFRGANRIVVAGVVTSEDYVPPGRLQAEQYATIRFPYVADAAAMDDWIGHYGTRVGGNWRALGPQGELIDYSLCEDYFAWLQVNRVVPPKEQEPQGKYRMSWPTELWGPAPTADSLECQSTWYHGGTSGRSDFHDHLMDRDRKTQDVNQHGPGIYLTSDPDEAAGYAWPDGSVYTLKVYPRKVIDDNTPVDLATLDSFLGVIPPDRLEIGLSNWGEDPLSAGRLMLNAYGNEDSLIDALLGMGADMLADAPDEFAKAMVRLGYDAYLTEKRGGISHLVVYNPAVIKIVSERKVTRQAAADDVAPVTRGLWPLLKQQVIDIPSHVYEFMAWPGASAILERLESSLEEFERLWDEGTDEFYELANRVEMEIDEDERYDLAAYIARRSPPDAPTWFYLHPPSIVRPNTWLVHFSDSAASIATSGFEGAISDPTRLGLTTYWSEPEREDNGYVFAFVADTDDARRASRLGSYGRHAVLFHAVGVAAYHSGDNETQVIVWGPSVDPGQIVYLHNNGDGTWSVIHEDRGTDLYSGSFDDVVRWVETNYEQYRRVLANADATYQFAWHCPAPPPELEAADEFAARVGGWEVVARDWYGGCLQGILDDDGVSAAAEFARNDDHVGWYESCYPDGTPIIFHTSSGIEHVYERRLAEKSAAISKGVYGDHGDLAGVIERAGVALPVDILQWPEAAAVLEALDFDDLDVTELLVTEIREIPGGLMGTWYTYAIEANYNGGGDQHRHRSADVIAPRSYPPSVRRTEQERLVGEVAHGLKVGEPVSVAIAAREMAAFVPCDAVLVPIPNSQGSTARNRRLADAISDLAEGVLVADVLHGEPRDSQYRRQRHGLPRLKPDEIEFKLVGELPAGRPVYLVDNVATTGATGLAAERVLGRPVTLLTWAGVASKLQHRDAGRKTLQQLLDRYPDDADTIRRLADTDPTSNHKWLRAMYQWYVNGSDLDDIVRVVDELDLYGPGMKKQGLPFSAGQFKTAHEAEDALEKARSAGVRPRLRKKDAEFEVVTEDDRMTLYHVLNKEAACVLGSDSDWCSAKWHDNWWERRITMYGGNDVYIARFNDGSAYMVRVANGNIVTAYDKQDSDVLGEEGKDSNYAHVVNTLLEKGIASGSSSDMALMLEQHGDWGHGGDPEGAAAEWTRAGFTPGEADSWLDAGIYDADMARQLEDASVDPGDVEGLGGTSDEPVGEWSVDTIVKATVGVARLLLEDAESGELIYEGDQEEPYEDDLDVPEFKEEVVTALDGSSFNGYEDLAIRTTRVRVHPDAGSEYEDGGILETVVAQIVSIGAYGVYDELGAADIIKDTDAEVLAEMSSSRMAAALGWTLGSAYVYPALDPDYSKTLHDISIEAQYGPDPQVMPVTVYFVRASDSDWHAHYSLDPDGIPAELARNGDYDVYVAQMAAADYYGMVDRNLTVAPVPEDARLVKHVPPVLDTRNVVVVDGTLRGYGDALPNYGDHELVVEVTAPLKYNFSPMVFWDKAVSRKVVESSGHELPLPIRREHPPPRKEWRPPKDVVRGKDIYETYYRDLPVGTVIKPRSTFSEQVPQIIKYGPSAWKRETLSYSGENTGYVEFDPRSFVHPMYYESIELPGGEQLEFPFNA